MNKDRDSDWCGPGSVNSMGCLAGYYIDSFTYEIKACPNGFFCPNNQVFYYYVMLYSYTCVNPPLPLSTTTSSTYLSIHTYIHLYIHIYISPWVGGETGVLYHMRLGWIMQCIQTCAEVHECGANYYQITNTISSYLPTHNHDIVNNNNNNNNNS
jgi:hypothetical protein